VKSKLFTEEEEHIYDLECDKEDLEQIIIDLKEKNDMLVASIDKTEQKNKNLEKDNRSLHVRIGQLEESANDDAEDMKGLETQIARLKMELASIKPRTLSETSKPRKLEVED
jgi:peptidoglycan hydrolase CwlO-like protein